MYEADDLVLGRRVTIEVCAVSEAAQLVREAKALAGVHHPGVPSVFGLGLEARFSYVVHERLYGLTLAEVMAERRKSPTWFYVSEIGPALVSVAEALAAVHAVAMSPVSLCPASVMLCAADRVVLLGVRPVAAHRLADRKAEDTRAFGALAFELFIGAPPADDHDDLAAIRPDVPTTLAEVISACLAQSPDQRPPMALVAEDLRVVPFRRRRATSTAGAFAR